MLALVAGLAGAGLAIVALEAIRAIAAMRLEARTGLAVQAAVLDRLMHHSETLQIQGESYRLKERKQRK